MSSIVLYMSMSLWTGSSQAPTMGPATAADASSTGSTIVELTRTLHGPGVTHLHYLIDK